ncbi:efflux RND transporter periplasmic adaptor subunit [Agarivorans gilvus]|uniref:Hemolysin D n=1 Tax=Agarivorans gilvus TaxID=680279 RepID=A0ABQ1I3I1_9ALTE|nr:efflux RND transporter periplasmic adaptor subunit [Agarivorans gilvus]GGB13044.1 hemolysin D [Agarivorans gilvus]
MQGLLITLTALLMLAANPLQAQSNAEQSITVSAQTRPITVELDAVIEAVDAATLAAQTSGRVLNLYYDVNDFVEKDAVILEITRTQQSAAYAAAEAQLNQATAKNIEAQRHWQRLAKLYPQGAISKGQLDQAEADAKAAASAVNAAKASLIQAKETLDYTVVKAPFSGVVTQRHIHRGETISVGQALYSGYSLENMRAVANIPQRYLAMINSDTLFSLEQNGQMLQSQDYTLFSHADPQSHSFKIRLNLPNQAYQLYPGTWAKLSFSYGQRQQIWIPHSAVVQRNELSAVYRKTEQGYQLSQVRLGKVQGEQIQVLAGLEEGDEIALSAYQTLLNKE